MLYQNKWLAVVRGQNWQIAKLSRKNLNITVKSFFEFEGKADDPTSESLRVNIQKNKIPVKKLKITFSCPGIITRIITLPLLSDKDLEKLLTEQVSQYFTLNTEDYVLDYRIVEQFEEDGQKRLRVLLAALPKIRWESFWSTCQDLGFKPKVVDLAADSLIRMYSKLGQRNKKIDNRDDIEPASAIIHLGSRGIEFILLEHRVFFLYSDLDIDLEDLKRFEGVSFEECSDEENIKVQQDIEMGLNPVFIMLNDLLNFFSTRHFGHTVDMIYLTGDLSTLPGLKSLFELQLEIPTKIGFPDGWMPRFIGMAKNQKDQWMKYGSLYGLAMRED